MRRIMLVLMLSIMGTLLLVPLSHAQEPDEDVALDVIARLNAWRLDEGVPPLKPNATLAAMALDQAQYVISLPDFPPDDFHAGRDGLHPRERALLDPFDWPYYGRKDRVAVGENAAQGSVDFAMNFWKNSPIHHDTALNPAYREVGVAAIPNRGAYLIFVDFGARPGVLPSLLDPRDDTTLYVTNEQYRFSSTADSIQTATTLQLFNGDGLPLMDAPIPWVNTLNITSDMGDAVYILESDGTHPIISAVNLAQDRVILPGYLPQPEIPPATATPTLTPTPLPQPTSAVEATAQPTAIPSPTPVPTATQVPTAVPPAADLRIEYTHDTLDIINISGAAANLSDLQLVGSITFPFTQFARVVDVPLSALPANHCLQIRDVTLTGNVVVPDGCSWVRSLVELNPSRLFWTAAPFEVQQNGATLATCEPDAGVCEVKLD